MDIKLNLSNFRGNGTLMKKDNTMSNSKETVINNLDQKHPIVFSNFEDKLKERIEKVTIILDDNGEIKLMVGSDYRGLRIDWYSFEETKNFRFYFDE